MSGTLTDAGLKHLKWLAERGGSGVLDRYNRIVAGGDVSPTGTQPAWLRLFAQGMIEAKVGRFGIRVF
jgi:hypothetical protein